MTKLFLVKYKHRIEYVFTTSEEAEEYIAFYAQHDDDYDEECFSIYIVDHVTIDEGKQHIRNETNAKMKYREEEKRREHYTINKERLSEQMKQYRNTNREMRYAQQKEYCQANKAKICIRKKQYREDNKDNTERYYMDSTERYYMNNIEHTNRKESCEFCGLVTRTTIPSPR